MFTEFPGLDELLAKRLCDAQDAVSRLDERVRSCAFARGWLARQHLSEAVHWGWHAGRVTSLEDLMMHDHEMDVQMPSETVRATHGVVRARRKAESCDPGLLSPAGALWLLGRRRSPPRSTALPSAVTLDRARPLLPQLSAVLERLKGGVTEDVEQGIVEWLQVLAIDDERLPKLLLAATALEAWSVIDPTPRQPFLGPILIAVWLRRHGCVQTHLLGLEAGVRELRRRPPPRSDAPLGTRLLWWTEVMLAAANAGREELNRLELARQIAVQRTGVRRAHSNMAAWIALFLEQPLVTAPMAAARLKVSGQTVRRLIAELGSTVTEVSGQARYRAWRL